MKPRIAIPEPCAYDPDYCRRALPRYLAAIKESGGEPVVIRLDLPPEEIARSITQCSAVLLPGNNADVAPQKYGAAEHPKTGPADPMRDAADELLLQDAYNMRKPVFGICYGLQSLNVWRTGTLVQHIESAIDHSPADKCSPAHKIAIDPGSLLAREMGVDTGARVVSVNSSHHQAADVPGDALRVVARCPDDGTIEAIEGIQQDHYVLAVQWHPEQDFQANRNSNSLFANFIRAAQGWHSAFSTPRSANATQNLPEKHGDTEATKTNF